MRVNNIHKMSKLVRVNLYLNLYILALVYSTPNRAILTPFPKSFPWHSLSLSCRSQWGRWHDRCRRFFLSKSQKFSPGEREVKKVLSHTRTHRHIHTHTPYDSAEWIIPPPALYPPMALYSREGSSDLCATTQAHTGLKFVFRVWAVKVALAASLHSCTF